LPPSALPPPHLFLYAHSDPSSTRPVNQMKPKSAPMSRREFATRAAYGAVAAVTPHPLAPLGGGLPSMARDPQQPADAPKLSRQSQAEAEARYQAIMSQYPD